MEVASPRISIITSTFNAAADLPLTIRSISEQTSRDFEWIVVDGNSSDGTQALLHENDGLISYWLSEPDRGIYDAWNKACKMARGEWLIFLGAGDELATPGTIAECIERLEAMSADTTVTYGRQILLSPNERIQLEILGVPWPEIQGKWEIGRPSLPPHGATFQRKSLFAGERPFDLRFSIASDSHFLLRAIRQQAPVFIPMDITRAPMGGVSFRLGTARQVGREIAAINRDLGLIPPLTVRLHDMLRLGVISLLNLLPLKTAHLLADLIRRLSGKAARWSFD
jgi:glycosyltransferase involved in cell wall biosynthesis